MFLIKTCWLLCSFLRQDAKLLLLVLVKLRVMHLFNRFYLFLLGRVARQMEESGEVMTVSKSGKNVFLKCRTS